MIKVIGLIVLIFGLLEISALLFIPLLLGGFKIKKKISHMNEETWKSYFRKMNNRGYFIRVSGCYLLSLVLVSIAAYSIFGFFHYQNPLVLTIVLFALGAIKLAWTLTKHKWDLIEKISRVK